MDPPSSMTQNSLREICEDADYGITLSDSTRLSTRLWKPIDALGDPVPVILEFLPYRKRDGTNARDALTHPISPSAAMHVHASICAAMVTVTV